MTIAPRFEKQVVDDEAEIRLSGAVDGERYFRTVCRLITEQFFKQRLNEVEEVLHLFQFAAAVLIELAVARQNVQFLEQFG